MTEWIIPCNPQIYDIKGAFEHLNRINWKQTATSIKTRDIVFIYVGRPYKKIMYKCLVKRVMLESAMIDDSVFIINPQEFGQYKRYMELELLDKYTGEKYSLDALMQHGLNGCVQGPRRLNDSLSLFLNS